MRDSLFFMPDGILRTDITVSDPVTGRTIRMLYPLDSFDEGETALLHRLSAPVVLYDGTTAASLVQCLAPFAAIISRLTGRDFTVLVDEVRRSDVPRHLEVSALVFSHGTAVVADGDAAVIQSCWRLCAYGAVAAGGPRRPVSLDLCPISQWAHVPVSVVEESKVVDLLSSQDGIARGSTGRLKIRDKPLRIRPPCPTFLECIVQAFLMDIDYVTAESAIAAAQAVAHRAAVAGPDSVADVSGWVRDRKQEALGKSVGMVTDEEALLAKARRMEVERPGAVVYLDDRPSDPAKHYN